MRSKRIRELRRELINGLTLDNSTTTEDVCIQLCQLMASRMRREIRLRFDDLGAGVSGLWAVTRDGVHIVIVTTSRSWMHRLVILLHEIAHMLCGHEPLSLSDEETNRILYTDLPSEMLDILASRTTMAEKDETEADMVAGALALGIIRWADQGVRAFRPDEETAAVGRRWYSLGYAPSRGDA